MARLALALVLLASVAAAVSAQTYVYPKYPAVKTVKKAIGKKVQAKAVKKAIRKRPGAHHARHFGKEHTLPRKGAAPRGTRQSRTSLRSSCCRCHDEARRGLRMEL